MSAGNLGAVTVDLDADLSRYAAKLSHARSDAEQTIRAIEGNPINIDVDTRQAAASLQRLEASSANATRSLAGAQTPVQRLSGSLGELGIEVGALAGPAGIAAVGAAMGVAARTAVQWAKAAADDAASAARLQQAIENTGASFEDYEAAIDGVIAAGEELAFSDDEIRGGLSALVAATGDVDEAMRRLVAAQDLARGANIDLVTASKLLARVNDENTSALRRYGVAVSDTATAQDVLNAVDAKFGGQAGTFAESDAATFERAAIAVDELKEAIGAGLLPIVIHAATEITDTVNATRNLIDRFNELKDAIPGGGEASDMMPDFPLLPPQMQLVLDAYQWLGEAAADTNEQLTEGRAALDGIAQSAATSREQIIAATLGNYNYTTSLDQLARAQRESFVAGNEQARAIERFATILTEQAPRMEDGGLELVGAFADGMAAGFVDAEQLIDTFTASGRVTFEEFSAAIEGESQRISVAIAEAYASGNIAEAERLEGVQASLNELFAAGAANAASFAGALDPVVAGYTNIASAADLAQSRIGGWEQKQQDANQALEYNQQLFDAGRISEEQYLQTKEDLTWATERYAAGVLDESGAYVEAQQRQAEYTRALDELNAKFPEGERDSAAYKQALSDITMAFDPAAAGSQQLADAVSGMAEVMDTTVTKVVMLLNQLGILDDTEVEAILGVDVTQAEENTREARDEVSDFASGSYRAQLEADNASALTSTGEATEQAGAFADGSYRAAIEAENADALAKAAAARDELNGYASGTYRATAEADTAQAISDVRDLQGAIDGVTRSFTIYADLDYTAVTAGLVTIEGFLPHSPAEHGPLAFTPDWSWLTAGAGDDMLPGMRRAVALVAGETASLDDLIRAQVVAGMDSAEDAVGISASEMAAAISEGVRSGAHTLPDVIHLLSADVVAELVRLRDDAAEKLTLAQIAGTATDEMGVELERLNQLLLAYAATTGQSADAIAQAIADGLDTAAVEEQVTAQWLDLLDHLDEILSGEMASDLAARVRDLEAQLDVALANGAPQAVIDALRAELAATTAQLEQVGIIYGQAIADGTVSGIDHLDLDAIGDRLSETLSGERLTRLQAELDRINALIAFGRARGWSAEMLAAYQAQADQLSEDLAVVMSDMQVAAAEGLLTEEGVDAWEDAIGIVAEIPLDRLRALIGEMEDGGVALMDTLVEQVAAGVLSVEDAFSLLDGAPRDAVAAMIAELERLEDQLTVEIAETLLDPDADASQLEAQLAAIIALMEALGAATGGVVDDAQALYDALHHLSPSGPSLEGIGGASDSARGGKGTQVVQELLAQGGDLAALVERDTSLVTGWLDTINATLRSSTVLFPDGDLAMRGSLAAGWGAGLVQGPQPLTVTTGATQVTVSLDSEPIAAAITTRLMPPLALVR